MAMMRRVAINMAGGGGWRKGKRPQCEAGWNAPDGTMISCWKSSRRRAMVWLNMKKSESDSLGWPAKCRVDRDQLAKKRAVIMPPPVVSIAMSC